MPVKRQGWCAGGCILPQREGNQVMFPVNRNGGLNEFAEISQ